MSDSRLPLKPILALMGLSVIFGSNWAIVKLGTQDFAPFFLAATRSVIVSFCLYIWISLKKIPLFPSRLILFHGIMVGLLFGAQFALLYSGLKITLASRTYVLLFTAPFFTAVGAHFFLQGDRLGLNKVIGLCLAFGGTLVLFLRGLGQLSLDTLPGDLMILAAGAVWGAHTVYIKKYLFERTGTLQVLFYSVFFSAPLLLGLSLIFENPMIIGVTWIGVFSVFWQSIVIAFLCYLGWFELIRRYPVSLIHAFSYFTPVFGVLISGALIMKEDITINLIIALVMVSLGMVLINRRG
ncbi:MAG: DMT family transporter [Pseudomonadota bacterium]